MNTSDLTIQVSADPGRVVAVCRIIARHLNALADELDEYRAEASDAHDHALADAMHWTGAAPG